MVQPGDRAQVCGHSACLRLEVRVGLRSAEAHGDTCFGFAQPSLVRVRLLSELVVYLSFLAGADSVILSGS